MNASQTFRTKLRRFFRGDHDYSENVSADRFFVGNDGSNGARDRFPGNFQDIMLDSLECWRSDPLARRIVDLTTEFAVGRGFKLSADSPMEDRICRGFWDHPLNRMDDRMREWSDELCRAGNLFIMLSSDPSGKSFVRAVPATQIEEIISRENDIEQPVAFRIKEWSSTSISSFSESRTVPAADLMNPTLNEAMLHFTINRPIGARWGESDLAPILIWLHRYSKWLEDRARLNHYRNSFLFVVKSPTLSEAGRLRRQEMLNRTPPHSGSILVTGRDEEWTVLSPGLESESAAEDGLAMKKMIAAGAGLPLQYFAEPGSSSKAEAEGVEGTVLRGLEQRQQVMVRIAAEVLRHVLARRSCVDYAIDPSVPIHVSGDVISKRIFTEGSR